MLSKQEEIMEILLDEILKADFNARTAAIENYRTFLSACCLLNELKKGNG